MATATSSQPSLPPPVQLEFALDERDFVRANMLVGRHVVWYWRIVCAATAVAAVAIAMGEGEPSRGYFWGAAVALVVGPPEGGGE